jgi:hypothetical protein
MLDRLEELMARALKQRAESVSGRRLNLHQVRRRARRLLLAEQLSAALALLILCAILWLRQRV